MRQMSAISHKDNTTTNNTIPPKFPDTMGKQLVDNFAKLCFNITFPKWCKRVNSNLSLLMAIEFEDIPKAHAFRSMREHIAKLAGFYSAPGPVIGRPEETDRKKWRQFAVYLRYTQKSVECFLATNPFNGPQSQRYSVFSSMESYVRKLTGNLNELELLGRAKRSPQCRHLFKCEFTITALPSAGNSPVSVPVTPQDREIVLEKAASTKPGKYDLDLDVIQRDCTYMARETISRSPPHSL